MIGKGTKRKKKMGLLTDEQLRILSLRLDGLKQEEIAVKLGTTRQNISLIERRARGNISKAEETLRIYRRLKTAATVELKPSTHLVDIPRKLVDAADNAGVKITIDFSLVYKKLRDEAGDSISGTRVVKPIFLYVLRDGEIDVESV